MGLFDFYWTVLLTIMATEILIGSIGYSIVVLKRKTIYPRWMAILSPMAIVVFTFAILLLMPSPIGGYVAPAFLNISTVIFFVLTLVVTYKRVK